MTRVRLSVGMGDYDHVRDLMSGRVPIEGLELVHLELRTEEIFHRFLHHREWDVSEISLAKYSALVSQGDTSLVGIPVFPSRVSRHSSIYVRADSGIHSPEELRGGRVGVPEWAQTASVYTRGLLVHEYGVALSDVEWFQAGVDQPGRKEKVELSLPPDVRYTAVPHRSLSEMLVDGALDAVFSAHPPACFQAGDGTVVRLFRDDSAAEEKEYRMRTGVFPIMHTVVVRRDVVDANPWIPTTLFKGFDEAKRRSVARMTNTRISHFPVPGLQDYAAEAYALLPDPWPYGVLGNRVTLELFLSWAYEQGVLRTPLAPEQLFAPSVDGGFRV